MRIDRIKFVSEMMKRDLSLLYMLISKAEYMDERE